MVQDLIVAARRVAVLYGFKYIQPSHLLHALTTTELGREVVAREGVDVTVLRSTMGERFRQNQAGCAAGQGHAEPSDLFDHCAESYFSNDDSDNVDGGFRAIFMSIRGCMAQDAIVKEALEASDMTRGVPPQGPDEDECLPDLDEMIGEIGDEDYGQPVRAYQGGAREPAETGKRDAGNASMGESMRSMYSDRGPRQGGAGKSSSPQKPRQTKETEESLAAIRSAQRDLSELARRGELPPVVGRDDEISHMIEVLMRRRKPNIILVAEPGVGKSALVEGLAQRLVSGACPDARLARRSVYEVSLPGLVAGSRYRGDFESRMELLIREAEDNHRILFIDEIHNLMGAGAVTKGGMDGANILKPALARDGLSLIGATTPEEAAILRADRAMMRRFEIIHIDEPSRSQMETILSRAAPKFLQVHGVCMSPETGARLLDFGARYLDHRRNPDRSFDLLDLAAVSARLHGRSDISEDDLRHAVRRLGGELPRLSAGRMHDGLDALEAHLKARVGGHGEAMTQLAALVQSRIGSATAPAAIRLVGAPGLGKTHAAQMVAAHFGKRLKVIGFDGRGPEALAYLWNRVAMALEADADAVVLIQGAADEAADYLDERLAGETAAGCLDMPVVKSPLVFCSHEAAARTAPGFGFRAEISVPVVAPGSVVFDAFAAGGRSEIITMVAAEIMEIQRDSGINLIQPDEVATRLEELDLKEFCTYTAMKRAMLDLMSNI